MTDMEAPAASRQDGTYPRPQMVRRHWADLSGRWEFEYDDDDRGLNLSWQSGNTRLTRTITVPYPPESQMSGVGDTSYHPILWYRRVITQDDVTASGWDGGRLVLLHFGAVDYHADVWWNGNLVASHDGGHTPFSARLATLSVGDALVVRVVDDPRDVSQPRGKQEWQEERHVIWYDRTSGIWQPVWLEAVHPRHLTRLVWRPDLKNGTVKVDLETADVVEYVEITASVSIYYDSELLARVSTPISGRTTNLVLSPSALRNGQDLGRFEWSAEHPHLLDARITLEDQSGTELDRADSYFGFRTVSTSNGTFLLNGLPLSIRAVLEQGFWPQSHLSAPSAAALRNEVELIKDLGFNLARVHQKIEDPRFIYWTDRLGLLLWAEMPSTYEYSQRATERLTAEWLEVLRRDISHPSVVTWVVFNESWGVDDLPRSSSQRDLTLGLYHLTRAIDPSRLIVSNDGWEHTRSDLLTIHDYENDANVLRRRYSSIDSVRAALDKRTPNGRAAVLPPRDDSPLYSAPFIVSEFGGVNFNVNSHRDGWGYHEVIAEEDFEAQLRAVFGALQESDYLAGWCYTQLSDTQQETNGLVDEHRRPKLPIEVLRAIVESA